MNNGTTTGTGSDTSGSSGKVRGARADRG
jgi:hypothetical protein